MGRGRSQLNARTQVRPRMGNPLISSDCLQTPRVPSALRAYVLALKDSVCECPGEFERALLKMGLYKEFLDEFVPLSCFASLAYPDDHTVELVLGNQPHDAIVRDSHGAVVDRVELTTPQDGRAEAEDRKLVAGRGFGAIIVGAPGHDLEALIPYVLTSARAKATKDYGDCTLVIAIEPLSSFEGFRTQYDETLGQLRGALSEIAFRAKRVYLLLMPDTLIAIHGQHAGATDGQGVLLTG